MFNKRNLIFIISIAILAVAGYYFYANFFKNNNSVLTSINSIGVGFNSPNEEIVGKDFVESVTRIRNIQIDTDFFNRTDFKALKDITPVVPAPEKVGKTNPFAPVYQ